MNISLCSGPPREGWITVDREKRLRPDIIADVRYLPLRKNLRPNHLQMSPPCTHFSTGRVNSGPPKYHPFRWPQPGIGEACATVGACLEAIPYLNPDTWSLENPCGHLQKILGRAQYEAVYSVADMPKKRTWIWTDKRALDRARLPSWLMRELAVSDKVRK